MTDGSWSDVYTPSETSLLACQTQCTLLLALSTCVENTVFTDSSTPARGK